MSAARRNHSRAGIPSRCNMRATCPPVISLFALRDILFPPSLSLSLLRANDAGGWRGGERRVEEDQHECYRDCDIRAFPQVAIYVTRERRRRRRDLVVAFALTSEREEETNRHGAGGGTVRRRRERGREEIAQREDARIRRRLVVERGLRSIDRPNFKYQLIEYNESERERGQM